MSYLNFIEIPNPSHKTKYWSVQNVQAKTELGKIHFYPQWRKYVFQPVVAYPPSVIFDAGCLQDIADFLKDQTQQWRDGL